MQGKLVTVFGGGGFLGRYVAQALLAQGARVRVACRNPAGAMHIKPLGNLGQVQLDRRRCPQARQRRACGGRC